MRLEVDLLLLGHLLAEVDLAKGVLELRHEAAVLLFLRFNSLGTLVVLPIINIMYVNLTLSSVIPLNQIVGSEL